MSTVHIPKAPEDVLSIPAERVPDVMRQMLREREFSPLLARIHADLQSSDPGKQRQSRKVLRHLGFTE